MNKVKVAILLLLLSVVCLSSGTAGNVAASSLTDIRNYAGYGMPIIHIPQPPVKDVVEEELIVPDDGSITLINPSFAELRTFILADPTSRNKFVLYEYECRHFATEVNNNAVAAGFRSAIVLIGYERGQHAVVAFETTDRGLVFIEPQTNAVIRPEVGGKYQGMKIKEILIAW